MAHSHGHSHSHHHHHHGGGCGSHESGGNIRRLLIVLFLTGIYMVVEFSVGLWANSLALIADAGHMLIDVGAIGLALFAAWFSTQTASPQKTYGYQRMEILAAFINGIFLALVAIYVIVEAVQRFNDPPDVKGGALMWVATGGLLINLVSAGILFTAGQSNINIRGALMHVISDSIGSLGAILAGFFILYFGFNKADPIFSIVIAVLVLINAWKLILEAMNVLLEACPVHLNVADIRSALTDLHEIRAVHDLHVWTITSGKDALSVHIVVDDIIHYTPDLVVKIQQILKERFNLTHLTIQLETPDFVEDDIHF